MAGPPETAEERYSLLQRIYNRCMEWIQTPAGTWALFLIAVAESSFSPFRRMFFLSPSASANQKNHSALPQSVLWVRYWAVCWATAWALPSWIPWA